MIILRYFKGFIDVAQCYIDFIFKMGQNWYQELLRTIDSAHHIQNKQNLYIIVQNIEFISVKNGEIFLEYKFEHAFSEVSIFQ